MHHARHLLFYHHADTWSANSCLKGLINTASALHVDNLSADNFMHTVDAFVGS